MCLVREKRRHPGLRKQACYMQFAFIPLYRAGLHCFRVAFKHFIVTLIFKKLLYLINLQPCMKTKSDPVSWYSQICGVNSLNSWSFSF